MTQTLNRDGLIVDEGNGEHLSRDGLIVSASSGTPVAFLSSGGVPDQNGTVSTPFSFGLASFFTGELTPFSYAVQAGTLPDGLTLNSGTGVISGTPTTPGTSSNIVIRATDTGANTADTDQFNIVIAPAPTFTVTIRPYAKNTGSGPQLNKAGSYTLFALDASGSPTTNIGTLDPDTMIQGTGTTDVSTGEVEVSDLEFDGLYLAIWRDVEGAVTVQYLTAI